MQHALLLGSSESLVLRLPDRLRLGLGIFLVSDAGGSGTEPPLESGFSDDVPPYAAGFELGKWGHVLLRPSKAMSAARISRKYVQLT